MFTIRRVEIRKFACFDNLVIEPSTDPERPLTVIRAENGCGKTTLLRAVRWGMYGERSIPGNSAQFSLHPADWHPHDDPVDTVVKIEFETDGSSRDDPQENNDTTTYELTRSVTTIGQRAIRADEPDFRRIDLRTQLTYRARDGSWHPHEAGVDAVVGRLLPWELRDFFVMDADEAADFVGGSENKNSLPQRGHWQDQLRYPSAPRTRGVPEGLGSRARAISGVCPKGNSGRRKR